ncbi:MAG: hypothetical protein KC619_18185, partial [Myxococcales bacterium]|nr:hypothetical protein [Myxococcales bacterium]
MSFDPHDPDDLEGEATAISLPPDAPIPESHTVPDAKPPAPARHAPPPTAPQRPFPATPSRPEDARPPSVAPHKVVPPRPAAPAAAPPKPAATADPFAPLPATPDGLVAKKPTQAFQKRGFTGTIMGTMVFIAQSKKIPLGVKIGVPLLLVVGAVVGLMVFLDVHSRDAATAALDAALALPPEEAIERVRTLDFDSLEPESQVRAIRFLGERRDGASMPRLMNALDGTLVVQRAAVDAIARIGAPAGTAAAEPLVGLLEAEDEDLRREAGWALVRIEDGRGVPPTLAAIAAGSPPTSASYDPRVLADTMGREGLLEALGHASATVRQLAAYHLGDHCQPTDGAALARIASDADTATADTALVTLARCDAAAAAPLVEAALAGGPARWNGLYTRMQQEAGAAGLGLLLPHAPDAPAHRWIMHEMAIGQDPRAADALVAELARTETPSALDRLDTGFALASVGDARLLEVLAPLLASEDDDHALAAIDLLGRSTDASVVEEPLVAQTRAGSDARRQAAVEAMTRAGACGDESQRQLVRLMGQRPFRSRSLRALARCGSERAIEAAERELATPLAPPITREQGELRLAALFAVAELGRADVAPALYAQLVAPETDPTIRTALADALAVLAPDPMRDSAVDQMLDPARPRPVRLALRRMLSSGVADASVPRLLGFVRGGADDDRTRDAALVLGLAHHAPSREELVRLLDDERGGRHAALALLLGGDADTAGPLARRVAGDDALRATLAADLDPAPWTFLRGRPVLPHLSTGVPLREAGFGAPLSRLCDALAEPPEGLRAPDAHELRRDLVETLTTSDSATSRRRAAEGLACSGGRAAVLNVRDGRGIGAPEARRAL